jgi:hypothetical protein
MDEGGQRQAPAILPPGKTRYPLYSKPGVLQGCSERVRKISPTNEFDPRTVQSAVSPIVSTPSCLTCTYRYLVYVLLFGG